MHLRVFRLSNVRAALARRQGWADVIFADCVACDEPLTVHYEAGDEPGGAGTFERVVCDCGAASFVELTALPGGRTFTEAEFWAQPKARHLEPLGPGASS